MPSDPTRKLCSGMPPKKVLHDKVTTAEAVRRNGGKRPTCGDPDHDPQHNQRWVFNTSTGEGYWARTCLPKRSPEEVAVEWLRGRLASIPRPGPRKSGWRYPLRPAEMKTGDAEKQDDPCVAIFDVGAIIVQHQETTGATRKDIAQRWSQFAEESLGAESALRQLHRLVSSGVPIPTLSLRRADELLLGLGHKLGQAPLPCLAGHYKAAYAMSRASFEVSGEPTNADKINRRARRILRVSVGYICGVEGYDPMVLLDAEQAPGPDPEIEAEVEEVAAA